MNAPPRLALSLALAPLVAGCVTTPASGLELYCNGNSALYPTIWVQGAVHGCPGGCYKEDRSKQDLCLDPSYWLGDDEVGEDTGADIDLENWPTDESSIARIQSLCEGLCLIRHASSDASHCYQEVEGAKYIIENYKQFVGEYVLDPTKLTCWPSKSLFDGPGPKFPSETPVLPISGNPSWPSDDETIELACGDFDTCARNFMGPVLPYLAYDDVNGDWGDDHGQAQYVATSSNLSSSLLTLAIHNSEGTSADSNSVEGRVEFSIPTCSESTCPLYIANLTLTNSSDVWELYSEAQGEDVGVTDVTARLRRAAFGVWRPATDEVYFAPGRLDIVVEVRVTVGTEDPVDVTYFATNVSELVGSLDSTGMTLAFTDLEVVDGDFEMLADLDYDTPAGSPPVASFDLAPVAIAPTPNGLPLASITDNSSDPDNDLHGKLWIVDGHQRPDDTWLVPLGDHTIELEVRDERGAVAQHEQDVEIVAPL